MAELYVVATPYDHGKFISPDGQPQGSYYIDYPFLIDGSTVPSLMSSFEYYNEGDRISADDIYLDCDIYSVMYDNYSQQRYCWKSGTLEGIRIVRAPISAYIQSNEIHPDPSITYIADMIIKPRIATTQLYGGIAFKSKQILGLRLLAQYNGNNYNLTYEYYLADGNTLSGWETNPDLLFNSTYIVNYQNAILTLTDTTLTLTYNSLGGSSIPSVQDIPYGGCLHDVGVSTLPVPTYSDVHYNFGGWYTSTYFDDQFDVYRAIYDDITLYAKWLPEEYEVQYVDSISLDVINTVTGYYNTKLYKPNDPVKSGYSFKGWYKDAEGTTSWNFNTDVVTADTTIYACWVVADLTVTFDSQGGSPVASVMVASGYKVPRPTKPTREGYIFKNWYTDTTYTTVWNFNNVVTEDMTLYALWAKSWTVTFVTNGGTAVAPKVVESGRTVTRPSNYRTGFTRVGWYTDTTYTDEWNFSTPITEDITLYELWRYNNINHKETFIMTADWTTIDADEEVERYDIHNDYGFLYKNVSTNEIHPESPESPDFVVDGNYVLDANNSYTYEIYNKIDRYVVDSNDPNVVYQRLVGGNIEDFSYIDYQVTQKTTGNSSSGYTTTATIKPIPVRKTVTFDSDGGSSVEQETVLRGSLITEPTAPTKEHYNFRGWYKEEECITPWNFNSDGLYEDTTLYAKWTIQTFTVTFNSNGGSQVSPYTSVEYGSKINEPSTPEKLENNFDGWYKDSEFETAWDFENDTVTEDITLYAKWVEWVKNRIYNPNAYNGENLKLLRASKTRETFNVRRR